MVVLRGLTWKHDRGLAPLVATAAEFESRHPDVRVEWEARSLHEFGDVSVGSIAGRYDLIVIDHPFMGEVARDRYLLPLDELLPAPVLKTLAGESVGASHESYFYDGHQWALAIDAAAQVAGYRPDLLEQMGAGVPQTWEEVLDLAGIRRGFVTPALLPLDSMMCFFSLCAAGGEPCFSRDEAHLVSNPTGEEALDRLKALADHAAPDAFSMNPIAVWERMSSTDEIAYCPLAFGYSNYSRSGYRRSLVSYTNIPGTRGATLGGAGLAITARCSEVGAAVEYAAWIAGADCQKTAYVRSGGQPGNRLAWTDPDANALTNGYFQSTLATLENAFVRPRYAGFVGFQTAAAQVVSAHLRGETAASDAITAMNALYSGSRLK